MQSPNTCGIPSEVAPQPATDLPSVSPENANLTAGPAENSHHSLPESWDNSARLGNFSSGNKKLNMSRSLI